MVNGCELGDVSNVLNSNTEFKYGHTFIPNVCRKSWGVVTVASGGMGDVFGEADG